MRHTRIGDYHVYIFIVAHKWNFGRKKNPITVALTITKNKNDYTLK